MPYLSHLGEMQDKAKCLCSVNPAVPTPQCNATPQIMQSSTQEAAACRTKPPPSYHPKSQLCEYVGRLHASQYPHSHSGLPYCAKTHVFKAGVLYSLNSASLRGIAINALSVVSAVQTLSVGQMSFYESSSDNPRSPYSLYLSSQCHRLLHDFELPFSSSLRNIGGKQRGSLDAKKTNHVS
jgi:hypothetical protein